MPDATIFCVDSSDYMRNGDFFPSRMSGVQEALGVLLSYKLQSNLENSVGFLTMGGKACCVRETLTSDADRLLNSILTIPISGQLHFSHGLLIAQLALSHRINTRHEPKIVAFVGSPLNESEQDLDKLAKKLRKDDIGVEIFTFGVSENVPLLTSFIEKVNKNNNSRLVNILPGESILAACTSQAGQGPSDGTAAAGQDFAEFGGVDPNADPELAMVLRMSLEEERRRVESAAQAENMIAAGHTTVPSSTSPPTVAGAPLLPLPARGPVPLGQEMDEEYELERALALSMEPQNVAREAAPSASAPQTTSSQPQPSDAERFDSEARAAMQDPEFLQGLRDTVEHDDAKDAKDPDDDVKDAPKPK